MAGLSYQLEGLCGSQEWLDGGPAATLKSDLQAVFQAQTWPKLQTPLKHHLYLFSVGVCSVLIGGEGLLCLGSRCRRGGRAFHECWKAQGEERGRGDTFPVHLKCRSREGKGEGGLKL